jgi:RNA polymerase sigma-32 factor
MNRRLSGDASLNAPMRARRRSGQWQDWLVDDDADDAEEELAESDEFSTRMTLLQEAMGALNEREQNIIQERRLTEEPKTLEDLAQVYGVSRERIRQIEVRAFEKLQNEMKRLAEERGLMPA